MSQGFDLVPSLAVVHNVLAGRLGAWSLGRALLSLVVPQDVAQARSALDRVGISEKLYERTSRLSGGEQQRVALARLLVQQPRAILADEPVASVDPARAEDLLAMLVASPAKRGEPWWPACTPCRWRCGISPASSRCGQGTLSSTSPPQP